MNQSSYNTSEALLGSFTGPPYPTDDDPSSNLRPPPLNIRPREPRAYLVPHESNATSYLGVPASLVPVKPDKLITDLAASSQFDLRSVAPTGTFGGYKMDNSPAEIYTRTPIHSTLDAALTVSRATGEADELMGAWTAFKSLAYIDLPYIARAKEEGLCPEVVSRVERCWEEIVAFSREVLDSSAEEGPGAQTANARSSDNSSPLAPAYGTQGAHELSVDPLAPTTHTDRGAEISDTPRWSRQIHNSTNLGRTHQRAQLSDTQKAVLHQILNSIVGGNQTERFTIN